MLRNVPLEFDPTELLVEEYESENVFLNSGL